MVATVKKQYPRMSNIDHLINLLEDPQASKKVRDVMAVHLYTTIIGLPEYAQHAGKIVGILLEFPLSAADIVILLSEESDLPAVCKEIMDAVEEDEAKRKVMEAIASAQHR
jgi:hypothetical protein